MFDGPPPLFGMVHLPPLPGAPQESPTREDLRARAVRDARTLAKNGMDGVIIENFGDAPFYPDEVPTHTTTELTAIAKEVSEAIEIPFGINVLRNDAQTALAIAAACGGVCIRVNVHTGVQWTDQGLIEGNAHETIRLREQLDADVAVFADVDVKHATAPGDRNLRTVAEETIDRGHADALVVSGPATGETVDETILSSVLDGRDDASRSVPVVLGSGVTPENVSALLTDADGAIVGTALKKDGKTTNPVDSQRVSKLVSARPSKSSGKWI
jgi:membrane complex biogenesis BtpA family protein